MPEVRIVSRTAVADRSAGGFFIRRALRAASAGALVEKGAIQQLARQALSPSNNKENVPPAWAATTAPKRRSHLPEWYPRTPLGDITTIIKAVERKRRLRDAATWQQIQWTEDSPKSVDLLQTEQGVPPSTPPTTNEALLDLLQTEQDVAVSGTAGSVQVVASTTETCLAEGMLKASGGDYSLQTPSRPNDPALTDLMEKKLASSIEQIEKMVSQNMRRAPKAAQPSMTAAVQRRTLMSMR